MSGWNKLWGTEQFIAEIRYTVKKMLAETGKSDKAKHTTKEKIVLAFHEASSLDICARLEMNHIKRILGPLETKQGHHRNKGWYEWNMGESKQNIHLREKRKGTFWRKSESSQIEKEGISTKENSKWQEYQITSLTNPKRSSWPFSTTDSTIPPENNKSRNH